MSDATSGSLLSDAEKQALSCVLDEIIPQSADGRFPGAGELGLASYLSEKAPDLIPLIRPGLARLDELATARGVSEFASLPVEERRRVLDELATHDPGFLPGLLFHTYAGYYQQAPVLEALGLEPRPPFPLGHEVEPNDLSLLDPVRERGALFRS